MITFGNIACSSVAGMTAEEDSSTVETLRACGIRIGQVGHCEFVPTGQRESFRETDEQWGGNIECYVKDQWGKIAGIASSERLSSVEME